VAGVALDLLSQRLDLTNAGARIESLRAEAAAAGSALALVTSTDSGGTMDADSIAAALPVGEELVDVLATITVASQRAGLEIHQLTRRPDRPKSDHVALDFHLATRGNYEQLLRFVDLIQESSRLLAVTQMHLRRIAVPAAGAPRLQVQLELHAFRWRDPGPEGDAPPPAAEAS